MPLLIPIAKSFFDTASLNPPEPPDPETEPDEEEGPRVYRRRPERRRVSQGSRRPVALTLPLAKALPGKQASGHQSPPAGYPEKRREYGDPANFKYPLDTPAHVRAAWSYCHMPKNQAGYSAEELAAVEKRIRRAGKRYGIAFAAA